MNEMVTAIITTYKRPPEMVKRAAESVLNQTYKNIELLIIDDSPATYEQRNDVRNMALALGENVRYIQHEKNMGACAARNTGIENAKGKYVAFLDDDDEWLPEKTELQKKVFDDNPEVALVYCGYYSYNTVTSQSKVLKTDYHRGNVYEALVISNFIGSTSFPLIKRAVLNEIGGFDIKMKAAQDYEVWLRIAKKYKVDCGEKRLVKYYVHEGEQITKNHLGRAEAFLRLIELNIDYLKKHRELYSSKLFNAVSEYSYCDQKKARSIFIKILQIYPFHIKTNIKVIKKLYIIPLMQKTKRR